MISTVRNKIKPLIGKKIKFRYNGSRNQIEEFEGTITKCYNYVFVINVGNMNKSFSYSDILMGILNVNI